MNTALPGLRLNEILARNVSTLVTNGESPDLVELFNAGATTVNLSGKGLTDDPLNKFKFTFASGASLAPGQFLVLFADNGPNPAQYLGFGLSQNGDSLYLFDAAGNGGALIDNISFGPQIADFSIGRQADGSWGLCRPTFGAVNQPQPTGDIYLLKINEWLASGSPTMPDDFVELYNPDFAPVAMGGLYLSDAPDGSPARHQIAALSYIAGGGYFAFKADGNTGAGPEHLNFHLAAEAGAIGLFAPDLSLIDLVLYGPQSTGVSQGRSPNGAATLAFFTTPTPGSGNPINSGGTTTSLTTTYTLIQLTNSWRYNASGADLGTGWKATNFVDSAWPSGPALLGIEPSVPYPYADPILTPLALTNGAGTPVITYYFRTSFNVTTNLAGFTIDTGIYLDDGAVFYLNGNEVGRLRITASPVLFNSLAQNQGSEGARESISIPASAFNVGSNYLAVEVHQSSAASSDIVFGMLLTASRTVTVTNYASIVLNEVQADNGSLTNSDGTITDWVELYNPTTNVVSLAGFSLTDDVSTPRRWVFPAGVTVAPGAFLVVRCDPNTPASIDNGPVLNTGFGLSSSGDAVYLYDASVSLYDSVVFGPQASDFSIGHVPDGTPGWSITLTTRGSANIAASTGDISNVRINEWAASVSGGPDWFELYNPNPQPVALGGLYLTDKLNNRTKHLIAPLSFIGIATNGYVVFIADGDTTQGPNHVNFSSDAAGEALGLFPPGTGPAIDTVTFGPQTSDVSEGRFPDGTTNRVFFTTPTPGEANWLPLTNIVVNEVLTHTDPPLEDAVELYNTANSAVNISGWYLSDSRRDLRKFRVPDGTVVPAHGYKAFYGYQFDSQPGSSGSFAFSSAKGDEVWVTAMDTNGAVTGYRATAKFGPQFNGDSFGRFTTSVGTDFTAMSALTFGTSVTAQSPASQLPIFRTGGGAANAYPRVGPIVFNEIMYRPPPNGTNDNLQDEFIELLNITDASVPLYDPVHRTNVWRLGDGVDFNFTTNHVLPPGGFLIVVSFDPATNAVALATFRSIYGTNGIIAGPWSGKLANGGEAIELQAPDKPEPPGPDFGLVPYVTMDRVVYSSTSPWPASADGTGMSLQRVSYTAYGNDPANWIAASPTAGRTNSISLADSDADSLPDTWEMAWFGTLARNGAGDFDADGMTDLQEFLAGTNPKDATDYFHILSVSKTTNGLKILFHAAGNRTYSVLYSTGSPAGPWHKLADAPVSSNPASVEITDTNLGDGSRFYRLVAPASLNP